MSKRNRFIIIGLIVGLIIGTGIVSSAFTSNKGIAFKDYDVNEDKQFTVDDVSLMVELWFETHGFTVSPPTVTKYDMDLDGDFDSNDVNITVDAYSSENPRRCLSN